MRWIGRKWCSLFHGDPLWPMHGRYVCPQCLREFSLAWEVPAVQPERSSIVLKSEADTEFAR